jgi:hypothetical protein
MIESNWIFALEESVDMHSASVKIEGLKTALH